MKVACLPCLVFGLLLAGVAGAATPKHFVETATSGNVQAELSYDYLAQDYRFSNVHLTIRRAGAVLLDEAVRPLASYASADPARCCGHGKAVGARDLDGGGEPEVTVDLYSGGAHCCWYTQVYRYIPSANLYLRLVHSWGNVFYKSADLDRDGLPEFVSADDRFAYEFTSFAGSSFPVQIWRYRSGRFVDVTRRFPRLIRRDARRQWQVALAKKSRGDNAGLLATWAADQCLLRHCASAFRQLEVLRREHRIGHGWDATPRKFLRHLRRFLRRTGYLR